MKNTDINKLQNICMTNQNMFSSLSNVWEHIDRITIDPEYEEVWIYSNKGEVIITFDLLLGLIVWLRVWATEVLTWTMNGESVIDKLKEWEEILQNNK